MEMKPCSGEQQVAVTHPLWGVFVFKYIFVIHISWMPPFLSCIYMRRRLLRLVLAFVLRSLKAKRELYDTFRGIITYI